MLDSQYQVITMRSSFFETMLKSSDQDSPLGAIYQTMKDKPE